MIRATPEDTASFGHRQKCGNCSTARLLRKTEYAQICQKAEFNDYNDIVPDHSVALSISLPRFAA